MQGFFDWVFRGVVITYLVPILFLLLRLGWRAGGVVSAVFLAPSAVSTAILIAQYGPFGDESATYVPPDTEMVYAAQPGLLADQVTRLRPGEAGQVELFALLGAGYPHESVFRREVEAVAGLLAERFAAADRVLRLVNSDADTKTYPLLNRVNLAAGLAALAEVMDNEDILFLFLTSHGHVDLFSTQFPNVITRDLTPRDVARSLDKAGIGRAIIVVSACYSGSFAEALAGPERLVLTAADADSSSFGCNDKNQWTDWGRAFFDVALRETRDPRKAARMAQASVADSEARDGLEPSSPMILEGENMGAILDRWLSDLEGGS